MLDVHAVLANYGPDFHAAHIEPLGFAGGMSGAQFWRITADADDRESPGTLGRGSADPARQRVLILRRWPAEHPSPERLRFIHAVLRYAGNRRMDFLPIPVTTLTGDSFIRHAGHLWELAPWMPGVADYHRSPRPEKLHAAMRALARFHCAVSDFACSAAPGSVGGSNAVVRHLARLRELTHKEISGLSRAVTDATWPELTPLARRFISALPRVIPPAIIQLEPIATAQLPLQPCLRDIWHDHVLFAGDEVTGLVDFGAIDIDTPATDIARLLGSFASTTPLPLREGQGAGSEGNANSWHEGLTAYISVRAPSHDETRAVHALAVSGTILAGCNWIRWIYIEGRQFENHEQVLARFQRICGAILSAAPD